MAGFLFVCYSCFASGTQTDAFVPFGFRRSVCASLEDAMGAGIKRFAGFPAILGQAVGRIRAG
jgi:hypothetical protein